MILVDANILLYAEDSLHPDNAKARRWWDATLSSADPVCLCWTVLSAFIRIGTNRRVFERPLSLAQAAGRVESWLNQPCTRIVRPTGSHWDVFRELLAHGQATANLVTDAHIAALAVQHGCRVASTDADFSRFPRLKWFNPLRD